MSARDEILGRIRRASSRNGMDRAQDYAAIPRAYRHGSESDEAARLDLFADRLHDYNAVVYRSVETRIAETVAEALTARGKHGMVIPPDLPAAWLPAGFEFTRDDGMSYDVLDRAEGVLTGCAVAIAFTGTIVLCHGQGEPRRALTLVPDYHLCVVSAAQLVETVPEGIRRMNGFRTRPLTTISGPSATSDIEMTRIKGVHGPRTLDVVLVTAG
jgi:L-lactate dehydrogenase complex protein LldG